ncbi:MAG TPA: MOSC domain-containing protein [Thermoplasmata archaeon]|nr:MOSC domain-containing protein [Thermoplasmata archaeon]
MSPLGSGRDAGRVFQLNRKSEVPGERGLPKRPVPEARFTAAGVEGDFNVYRHEVSHDDPAMAILIVPLETLQQLGREGWPVRPGDLGENVTSAEIPYDAIGPGDVFRIGGAVVEISKPCTPCDNLFQLPYVGERRGPEFLRVMLDRRGWYARVLEEGVVRVRDPIERRR